MSLWICLQKLVTKLASSCNLTQAKIFLIWMFNIKKTIQYWMLRLGKIVFYIFIDISLRSQYRSIDIDPSVRA